MAEDIYHARHADRARSAGRPRRALIVNPMIFNHTKYPNAAKEYLRFMMEREQYVPWQEACIGYWQHTAQGLRASADLDRRTRSTTPFRDILEEHALWDGYKGKLGEASAAVLADFVVVKMVASGRARARRRPRRRRPRPQRRAERYYQA